MLGLFITIIIVMTVIGLMGLYDLSYGPGEVLGNIILCILLCILILVHIGKRTGTVVVDEDRTWAIPVESYIDNAEGKFYMGIDEDYYILVSNNMKDHRLGETVRYPISLTTILPLSDDFPVPTAVSYGEYVETMLFPVGIDTDTSFTLYLPEDILVAPASS